MKRRKIISFVTVLAVCLSLCPAWVLADEGDAGLCPHHPAHTETCGYVPGEDGAPCTFVCRVCPIEDLIGELPDSVTPDNRDQVEEQLNEILTQYTGLTAGEQEQVDLSRCLALQTQLDAANVPAAVDDITDFDQDQMYRLSGDETNQAQFPVRVSLLFNTCGYTYTAPKTGAIKVTAEGELYFTGGGQVSSLGGNGVEVSPGGKLYISDTDLTIGATMYALYIESGAVVELSSGTYSGRAAAIWTEDGDFAALLKPGYAYFDTSGNPIKPADAGTAKKLVVKACTDHVYDYTHNAGTPTHAWTCQACGQTVASEPCTFLFDENGWAQCDACGDTIAITVDESALGFVYDGSEQKANVIREVTLGDGARLVENTDYAVTYSTRTDVGEITVTVTGITYSGTFTKTYYVTQDQPVIAWGTNIAVPVKVDYDGSAVEKTELPEVIINIKSTGEDLHQYLQYTYKGEKDAAYTSGLPTNAGTYEIVVSLPEMQNFHAASSAPITLIINKIDPIITAPEAKTLTYNGAAQQLITPGTVWDGAVIEYARNQGGPYSTDIPDGTDAGDYDVWYRVIETDAYENYDVSQTGIKIDRVKIAPKVIDSSISIVVQDASYVYDGSKKAPKITVKDGTIVVAEDQYTFQWTGDLTSAGTHTVTIVSSGKNYAFSNKTAVVEIVEAAQGALSITGNPGHICYGDTISTLSATGGVGGGTVTWSIVNANPKSFIDPQTGVLAVKDTGTITVKAVQKVDNYKTVEATCSIIVEPKPVMAKVTAASKVYDGTVAAGAITAAVDSSDLVNNGDSITISKLTGTYADANVGTNKTVTLDHASAEVTCDPSKYSVSFPDTVKADITAKPVTVTVALSDHDLQTDAGGYYYDYDGSAKTPTVTVTYTENGNQIAIPSENYTVTYSNNKNVGDATVTVTAKAGGNYTFSGGPAAVQFEIRNAAAVLTSSPQAKSLTYTGQLQDLVTVGTATGGTVWYSSTGAEDSYGPTIPQETNAKTYTVYYKVKGDANHQDSGPWSVSVTIKQKEIISPDITVVAPDSFTYNGKPQEAAQITVTDNGTTTIPESEYKVAYSDNVNAGTAIVHILNKNGGNYIVNGSTTFEIGKAPASVTSPTGKKLPYNGTAQELIIPGTSLDGTVVYSLAEAGPYSASIPVGTDVKNDYKVWYKVLGDSNHEDSNPVSVDASIVINNVSNPTILVSPASVTYTGQVQEPVVTVKDDSGFLIDSSEYTAASSGNMEDVGEYTLTITSTGGNYTFDTTNNQNTAKFEILPVGQEPLTIVGTRERVYYGDQILLATTGGNGTIKWESSDINIASIDDSGLLTVKGLGAVKIKATSTSEPNYIEKTAIWPVHVEKKPVEIVWTAANKTYDGGLTTTVTGTAQSSALVSGDSITISGLTGTFDDENAGANKKVTVTVVNPTVGGTNADKYNITYPATTTATIFKANIDASAITAPSPVDHLEYTGAPQKLIGVGVVTGGTLEYSLDGLSYSPSLPTGTNAGSYDVWYRVKGDSNHNDVEGKQLPAPVTIAPLPLTADIANIVLTPSSAVYDGNVKKPAVTVKDASGRIIPEQEYEVIYDPNTDWKEVGNYKVTVQNKTGGNYDIAEKSAIFAISVAEQNPLEIVSKPGLVYYGDSPFTLSAVGGSGNGAVTWSSDNSDVADIDENNGLVTIKNAGTVTITATKAATQNYGVSTAIYKFTVLPKPVANLVVTLENQEYTYDGSAKTPSVTVEADGKTLDPGQYTVSYTDNENAGTATVTVQSLNYAINTSRTFEIKQATLTIKTLPTASTIAPEELLSTSVLSGGEAIRADTGANVPGSFAWTEGDITPENGTSYEVTFTPNDTRNYRTVTCNVPVTVTAPETPEPENPETPDPETPDPDVGGGDPDDGDSTGDSGSTGGNSSNDSGSTGGNSSNDSSDTGNSSTDSRPAADESGAMSIPVQASVQNDTASAALSASAGNALVRAAAVNQSEAVVIKPEITSGVTKTEVSIPTSTVSQLGSATRADLTVSTPIADVTIPNEALDTLSSAGSTVKVVTEQLDGNTVVLTLLADDQLVGEVPNGVTLAVPVEDAAPGSVAMLVHADGTHEVIRKSVAADGVMSVPLDGSATIEIVDNSKEFDDVPAENWAADAVAFASAHELFSGTSETTFSPDQPMSRGMLATVLYSLEGCPALDTENSFSDVSSDAWYAAGIAWAVESGIANGYGNDQFGPDDSLTREQFVVILWKYAGSPEANEEALGFTDADQVSGYAEEALSWAVASGILSGYGDGRIDPSGLATRAQAAQMLKKFMENA